MSIYGVFRHSADIWTKSTTTNAAGQAKASWALGTSGVKCHYIPRTADVRFTPTYEETETVTIFFPADSGISYATRVYNITDKYGNVIEAGPVEIISVLPQPGFEGKIHHIVTKAKRVVET